MPRTSGANGALLLLATLFLLQAAVPAYGLVRNDGALPRVTLKNNKTPQTLSNLPALKQVVKEVSKLVQEVGWGYDRRCMCGLWW